MINYYKSVLNNYVTFTGRARRAEYRYFVLCNLIIAIILSLIGAAIFGVDSLSAQTLSGLYSLAVLIPGIAVSIRRLHDSSKSGRWILIGCVPFIGPIWLIVLLATDSSPGDNKFGPNPK